MGRYPHIIAYAGVARSGKTTAAQITKKVIDNLNSKSDDIDRYTAQCSIRSYAGPIREALEAIDVYKSTKPEMYREMAQYIGATARKYDPDYWMNLMHKNISVMKSSSWVVVDDVRYWNEVRQLEKMGAVLIYVDPGKRMENEINSNPLYNHESEKMSVQIYHDKKQVSAGFQYVAANDQDIDKYQTDIERITNKIVRDLIPLYR